MPPPKFQEAPIEPFTKEEVELLLKACEFSVEVQPSNRRKFIMRRWADKRDQAILLTLLDTGLRASDLSALKVSDVDLKSGKSEELASLLRQRYKYGRIQADMEICNWLRDCAREHAKA